MGHILLANTAERPRASRSFRLKHENVLKSEKWLYTFEIYFIFALFSLKYILIPLKENVK